MLHNITYINEFLNLKSSKTLNTFHTNINGLKPKFDNLQEFVLDVSSGLGIIDITETSNKKEDFFTSVSLYGHDYTSSLSSKGGTAIRKQKFRCIQEK